jgi:hypothetical protein
MLVAWVAGSRAQTGPLTADWPWFRDEAHGVSFAYPPELHPVISPSENLRGIEGWVSRVTLVAGQAGGVGKLPVLSVNVFLCDQPGPGPRRPCVGESFYRTCDRFEKFPVGDATGIQCVNYSRGACWWSVVVRRDKGTVEISAPAADTAVNLRTTDRAACADGVVGARTQSPLKEMLASFRFRRAG